MYYVNYNTIKVYTPTVYAIEIYRKGSRFILVHLKHKTLQVEKVIIIKQSLILVNYQNKDNG